MRDWIRTLIERSGYVIHRAPAHRFDAMDAALRGLQANGYHPRVVIDGGANRGQWFGLASSIFRDSEFHEIEPQSECWPALEAAATARGRTSVHRTVITAPGITSARMHRGGNQVSTGAFVIQAQDEFSTDLQTPACTLDELMLPRVQAGDRALLKLDLEGHEIEALRGAAGLLERLEAIVCEVGFFDVNDVGRPRFGDVMTFLEARDFMLFDFASLHARMSDGRLWLADAVFIRRGTPLVASNRRD
jgi:FkbM family methyltransferase